MRYNGKKFLKKELLPFFWCSGCGNGIVMGCIVRAMEESGFSKENTVAVTGIGCWGKADDYLTTHASWDSRESISYCDWNKIS